ncbi:MAG TPA: sulfotransferase [Rudaea sp.]
MHCRQLCDIERVLPEAHFVHIVRDGRDAAVSLRERWFSPGRDIEIQARFWRENVFAARALGARCARYMEVHYEKLLRDPEQELRRIAEFIDLPFERTQLDYHRSAAWRLAEHGERRTGDGSLVLSQAARQAQQASTAMPPDPSRVGVWRAVFTKDEADRFDTVAGDALEQFGYPRAAAASP